MIQIARLLKVGQKIKILSCNQILQIIPLYIVKKIFGYTKTTKIIIYFQQIKRLRHGKRIKN